MYSFSYLESVCCSMSGSKSCFLICIQISQEAGQVAWYSYFFKNFPQFVVIHTVRGFSAVSKAEVDVFLELSCFSIIQWMLAIWSLVPLPFLNPAWTSWSSWFMCCWSLREFWALLFGMWIEWKCGVVWTFFGIALLLYWNENWLFPVMWQLMSFQNLLAYWV